MDEGIREAESAENGIETVPLAALYADEKQESVETLANAAEAVREELDQFDYDASDVIRDILLFFGTVVLAFAWVMVMLLILSFITLSYLHFRIEWMFLVSVLAAVASGVYYVRKMTHKYRGKRVKGWGRPRERSASEGSS